jgi:hypothetical protein
MRAAETGTETIIPRVPAWPVLSRSEIWIAVRSQGRSKGVGKGFAESKWLIAVVRNGLKDEDNIYIIQGVVEFKTRDETVQGTLPHFGDRCGGKEDPITWLMKRVR